MFPRLLLFVLILSAFSCTGKKHSGASTSSAAGKEKDSLWHLTLHENGAMYYLEDISREDYLQKLSMTDTMRCGTIGNWTGGMFDPFTFRREDGCIFLPLDNGTTQKFCDSVSATSFSRYTLVGYIKDIHCVCLVNQDNSGQAFLLYNRRSGYIRGFSAFPALSPQRTHYLACAYDMQGHGGIEIGSMRDSLYLGDTRIDGRITGNWRAASPVWVTENEATFRRIVMDADKQVETTHYCHVVIR